MKQVIDNIPSNSVSVDSVTCSKFYGVDMGNRTSKNKGFVTRTVFGNGHFTVRSLINLTEGNGWPHTNHPSLQSLVKYLLIELSNPVYEFDSVEDLMEWLLEQ